MKYDVPFFKKGTVKAVDLENYQIDVLITDEQVLIRGVRLFAALTSSSSQISIMTNMVGMEVGLLFDQHGRPYAIGAMYNDVHKPNKQENYAIIDNMKIDVDSLIFNNGEYGGLTIGSEIAEKLNRIENKINDLILAISGWSPVPQDGGAALKIALSSWLSSNITPLTQASDIEETKITH